MKLVSLILACFHLSVGFLIASGHLLSWARFGLAPPFWLNFISLAILGVLPLWMGVMLFRGHHAYARRTGSLLIETGAFFMFGFLVRLVHGAGYPAEIVLIVAAVGLFPLATGILLFRQMYVLAEKVMKWALGGWLAIFVLSAGGYFVLSARASEPLKLPAATGLIGAR